MSEPFPAGLDRIHPDPSGYIRLPFAQFRQLTFPKRMAFEDHDLRDELAMQALPVLSAGFCDWVDDTSPRRICIGWAWYRCLGDALGRMAPGGFSSNVQFVGSDGRALDNKRADRLLRAWLATHPWQDTIQGKGAVEYRLQVDRMH